MFHGHCLTNPARASRRKMQHELPQGEEGALAALPYREAPAFMVKLREAEGIAARCLEFAVLAAARTNDPEARRQRPAARRVMTSFDRAGRRPSPGRFPRVSCLVSVLSH